MSQDARGVFDRFFDRVGVKDVPFALFCDEPKSQRDDFRLVQEARRQRERLMDWGGHLEPSRPEARQGDACIHGSP